MNWTRDPEILIMPAKKLVGMSKSMTLAANTTGDLWRTFMPRRREVQSINSDLISMQVYPPDFDFNPNTPFVKWAAIEIDSHAAIEIPDGMERVVIPEGLYACFHYQGSSTDPSIFRYIFAEWLPKSGFIVDDRPHFEVLGAKYRNADPLSEEDIYIPIKKK